MESIPLTLKTVQRAFEYLRQRPNEKPFIKFPVAPELLHGWTPESLPTVMQERMLTLTRARWKIGEPAAHIVPGWWFDGGSVGLKDMAEIAHHFSGGAVTLDDTMEWPIALVRWPYGWKLHINLFKVIP